MNGPNPSEIAVGLIVIAIMVGGAAYLAWANGVSSCVCPAACCEDR